MGPTLYRMGPEEANIVASKSYFDAEAVVFALMGLLRGIHLADRQSTLWAYQ